MSRKVVPVSRLVRYIKEYMESDPVLHGVMIEGEISNLRIPNSGHWYFSLKDEKASLTCVMFAFANRKVSFQPKNGDKVILIGDVSVYESMGSMQMVASSMQPSGIGDLYLQFEALKKKLFAEGLFAESHKKPLPKYPMDIALVTGSNTAARSDVLITFQKRWPIAKIHEYPAQMQGKDAAPKIIDALLQADQNNHQLIVLARGGGSLEDLWCFNDEALAKTIYNLHTPIITGIGHETDTTLVDYVADVRANTPTGAVEIGTPDIVEVQSMLLTYKMRLMNHVRANMQVHRKQFQYYKQSTVFQNPQKILSEKIVQLQFLSEKLHSATHVFTYQQKQLQSLMHRFNQQVYSATNRISETLQKNQTSLQLHTIHQLENTKQKLNQQKESLENAIVEQKDKKIESYQKMLQLLDAYSPLKVLERGYSVTYLHDKVITNVQQVQKNDTLVVRLFEGSLKAKVEEIENERK